MEFFKVKNKGNFDVGHKNIENKNKNPSIIIGKFTFLSLIPNNTITPITRALGCVSVPNFIKSM